MLRFVPEHLKTKKMCQNAVNKLPFIIEYILINIRHKNV